MNRLVTRLAYWGTGVLIGLSAMPGGDLWCVMGAVVLGLLTVFPFPSTRFRQYCEMRGESPAEARPSWLLLVTFFGILYLECISRVVAWAVALS